MSGSTRPLAQVPGLWQVADRQGGVIRRDQLADLGVSRHHIRSQLRAQRWQAVGPRTIVLMTGPLTADQSRWAAVLHGGVHARLSGLTTLDAAGLAGWSVPKRHIVVPHGINVPAMDWLVVHRSRRLPDDDITTVAGLPSTSTARAAIDAASRFRSERSAQGLVLAVVRQGIATPADMLECLAGLEKVRHTSAMRLALRAGREGAESASELDMGRLLRRAGLSEFRRQVPLMTSLGPRRIDVLVDLPDGTQLALEVDGPHHQEPVQRRIDAAKDAAAAALGIPTIHVDAEDASRRGWEVVAMLVRLRTAAEKRSGS